MLQENKIQDDSSDFYKRSHCSVLVDVKTINPYHGHYEFIILVKDFLFYLKMQYTKILFYHYMQHKNTPYLRNMKLKIL